MIDLAALQRRRAASPRRGSPSRPAASRSASCASSRRTPPSPARRPGLNETNLYGPGADRRLLEAVLADPLDVFLRHDPAGAGGARIVESGNRATACSAGRSTCRGSGVSTAATLLLDEARGVAAIALERELHVLRRHRLAVVELDAGAQHEVVAQPVGRRRSRTRPGTASAGLPGIGFTSASCRA